MTFDFLAMGFSAFGWGALSDRVGPRPVAWCGAVLIGAGQLLAARMHSLFAFQVCYGLVADRFGVMGAAPMVSSLAMALGPLAGGWVFDRYGDYGWLYGGSFAVGLAAAAISLAFPPAEVRGEPQPA